MASGNGVVGRGIIVNRGIVVDWDENLNEILLALLSARCGLRRVGVLWRKVLLRSIVERLCQPLQPL
jgi:hypothetical protein